jgi:hypothetical protein
LRALLKAQGDETGSHQACLTLPRIELLDTRCTHDFCSWVHLSIFQHVWSVAPGELGEELLSGCESVPKQIDRDRIETHAFEPTKPYAQTMAECKSEELPSTHSPPLADDETAFAIFRLGADRSCGCKAAAGQVETRIKQLEQFCQRHRDTTHDAALGHRIAGYVLHVLRGCGSICLDNRTELIAAVREIRGLSVQDEIRIQLAIEAHEDLLAGHREGYFDNLGDVMAGMAMSQGKFDVARDFKQQMREGLEAERIWRRKATNERRAIRQQLASRKKQLETAKASSPPS